MTRLRTVRLSAVLVSPWLLGALPAAGIALRVAQYVANSSLWADEAYLALNLLNRSASELPERFDFNQAAPSLFLLLEKLAVATGGASEYVVRFVSLLGGIASVGVFALLARRLLHPAAAPLGLLLFAVSDGQLDGLVIYRDLPRRPARRFMTDDAAGLSAHLVRPHDNRLLRSTGGLCSLVARDTLTHLQTLAFPKPARSELGVEIVRAAERVGTTPS